MALVELKSARAVLEGHVVFDSLDFQLNVGQSAAIVGANGAGKTTLLRLLAGELWPQRAESRTFDFGNGPTWSPLHAREEIAFLSPFAQEKTVRLTLDGVDGEHGARLTVRECVATGFFDSFLLHQKLSAQQVERIEAALREFHVEDVATRELGTLSQGQLRRVLLARALVKGPRLVLLDEAASGLDARARAELFAVLGALGNSGTSFVFASHRREELPAWAQRWTLGEGELKHDDKSALFASAVPVREMNSGISQETLAPGVVGNATESVFVLRHVSVFLGGNPILRDLDWHWPHGVHLRVRGENGSGKSTFLRLLGGELAPAHGGSIERLGEINPRPIWEWRRRIALVSPLLQTRFHDAISVREAIASGFEGGFVAPRQLDGEQRDAVEVTLDEWQLRPLAERRFDRLSFGQTRRVLLARALVAAPEVVLLDEANDGLDVATREQCAAKWAQLARSGVHFAFASHHDEDFPDWMNGEVILADGKVIANARFMLPV
ncbi:putative ABC transporter ATP-binding protein [Abditibacteriota bacterium]|nr:putative ABC transporter ATP-binding protein [Abditibacteriota bacterium]